jgi:hypothetical protein
VKVQSPGWHCPSAPQVSFAGQSEGCVQPGAPEDEELLAVVPPVPMPEDALVVVIPPVPAPDELVVLDVLVVGHWHGVYPFPSALHAWAPGAPPGQAHSVCCPGAQTCG